MALVGAGIEDKCRGTGGGWKNAHVFPVDRSL